ncbi:MAG: Fic family protein, partial [Alphaproteobacteria bacterium]|nr:Fic family protein [Alphaproteobacteria bacterium]
KTPDLRKQIEHNREIISQKLTGSGTVKRLHNINWLRHQISYEEPRTLFHVPAKSQAPLLDYNCMKNIGDAYDFIVDESHTDIVIDANAVRQIHAMLCANTNIDGGALRTTGKILEIQVNGQRMHAPDTCMVPYLLGETTYKMLNDKHSPITRAFNIHYDLIALQPFDDFNKRTARMIMNWVLVQNGYRPITFNYPSDKRDYRTAIAECANGNTKAYNAYMYSCMLRTQHDIIKILKKARIL